ncbi:DUF3360 domain-containing protein [Shewanella phaeophyticola]|uniref:DUF3360 domain-containing protein n=1 Tax=Shewanella phaeophyticola TaxID=2978345 RepID=A0ABT2P5M6_9GAMM|nr:DUF3360 domain-containing protein [Shewanella sp. KJ10-1]MCT8986975.1 DUF3360 domain-containing protein [Shewanella sp. KJ10-1]
MSETVSNSETPKKEASYSELHRPASEFETRDAYLENELKIMKPRRWGLNLPGRDFRFEWEDLVPAIAGTIGITVMYSAVMAAWAAGLSDKWDHVNLGAEFAIQIVRVEMLIPALLFCIISSGFINPRANLGGNHGYNDPVNWYHCTCRCSPTSPRYLNWYIWLTVKLL